MNMFIPYQNEQRRGDDVLICLSDRFDWFAFLLPPLWALWNRLWMVLAVMVGFFLVLAFAGQYVVFPALSLYLLAAWWLGFEAGTLRGASLKRRGWRQGEPVLANDLLEAEQKVFSSPWAAPLRRGGSEGVRA